MKSKVWASDKAWFINKEKTTLALKISGIGT